MLTRYGLWRHRTDCPPCPQVPSAPLPTSANALDLGGQSVGRAVPAVRPREARGGHHGDHESGYVRAASRPLARGGDDDLRLPAERCGGHGLVHEELTAPSRVGIVGGHFLGICVRRCLAGQLDFSPSRRHRNFTTSPARSGWNGAVDSDTRQPRSSGAATARPRRTCRTSLAV